MKKKKYLICAALFLAASLTGCKGESVNVNETSADTTAASIESVNTEASTEKDTEAVPKDNKYVLTEENVKLLGRTYLANDTLWLTYSGSGVEFTVTGKAANVVIYGDSTAANSSNTGNYARFAIYLDGERIVDDVMDEGAKNITIFEGEEERTATVRIVKLSETAMSIMGLKLIAVTAGEISPTDNKDIFVEFVGDSITCGYGVDDEDRNHSFSTATEDVTKAYAYKTAQLLDADYSCVSISGYGIISGYSNDGNIRDSQVIPAYYDTLGFSYGSCGFFTPSETKWDFSRQPDAVVINLGTNDSSYCGSDAEKQQQFKEGYVAFLEDVREKNPDAVILCTLGLMGDSLYPKICEAVEEYIEQTGDSNISTLHLDPIKGDEGYAADWHPTEKTHTRAAEAVAEALKDLL